jgi:hypothetical protein
MLVKKSSVIAMTVCLAGCSNAISYHHSERSSIALEARTTDPQQPLQGIIGVKTRTIIVAPGMTQQASQANIAGNGESTSLISDFKFERDPNEWWWFGSTVIQSAYSHC